MRLEGSERAFFFFGEKMVVLSSEQGVGNATVSVEWEDDEKCLVGLETQTSLWESDEVSPKGK